MSDKVKCPKCGQETFENPRYMRVKDEMMLFDGQCTICGYGRNAEEVYNDFRRKFDLEKSFDDLEKLLENILEKAEDEDDSRTKHSILVDFVRGYDGKIKKAVGKTEIEKYFYKKMNYQQTLEEKEFSEKEILRELARIYKGKEYGDSYAVECYKHILSLDPNDAKSHLDLAKASEDYGEYNDAAKNYEQWYQLLITNCSQSNRLIWENEYFKNLARLNVKKGESAKALDMIYKNINLKSYMEAVKEKLKMPPSSVEEMMPGDFHKDKFTLPVQVKCLELRALVNLGKYEKALSVYDEIEKIKPDFLSHYYSEETETVVSGSRTDTNIRRNYFDFCDFDDTSLFACLTKLFWEKGKPYKIGEIYNKIFDDYNENDWEPESSLGEFWDRLVIPYLIGRSKFKYLQSLEQSDKKSEFVRESLWLFDMVLSFYEGINILSVDHDILTADDIPTEFSPMSYLFPRRGNCYFECHYFRGKLYELLDDYDNAFAEFKTAQRYDPDNQEIKNKIEELWKRFINALHIEAANLEKLDTEKISVDTTQRILSILDSIREAFPKHYEKVVRKLSRKELDDIYLDLRRFTETHLNKIYTVENRNSIEGKSFLGKVRELQDDDKINPYIRSLLELIWHVCSDGIHDHSENPYIEDLKLEDIEVIISAEVRFLNWYIEKYSNKK